MIRRIFLVGVSAALLLGCEASAPDYDTTYYLVRHAEKTTEKPDPALTEAGQKRAQDLAERLSKVPLTAIYSSDYRRTRDTAAPVSDTQTMTVKVYDPRDLVGFAKSLSSEKGNILVVGHSNTTPELSELLGGDAGDPIIEATEYNRLYILRKRGDEVLSEIVRYGSPNDG